MTAELRVRRSGASVLEGFGVSCGSIVVIAVESHGRLVDLAGARAVVDKLSGALAPAIGSVRFEWTHDHIVCLVPGRVVARAIDEAFRAALATVDAGNGRAIAGIGSPATSVAALENSYREALDAIEILTVSSNMPCVLQHSRAWPYRMLLREHALDTGRRSVLDNLGNGRSALLPTLSAFVDSMGNLTEAARRLDVNRRTLYRHIEQIQRLTGLNLAQADDFMIAQLELCALRLRPSSSESVGSHRNLTRTNTGLGLLSTPWPTRLLRRVCARTRASLAPLSFPRLTASLDSVLANVLVTVSLGSALLGDPSRVTAFGTPPETRVAIHRTTTARPETAFEKSASPLSPSIFLARPVLPYSVSGNSSMESDNHVSIRRDRRLVIDHWHTVNVDGEDRTTGGTLFWTSCDSAARAIICDGFEMVAPSIAHVTKVSSSR